MSYTNRNSNIELLRIVSMFMIILHHAVVHGGGISMANCVNKWIALSFVPFGKIGFVSFIAISCWFLIDSKFKSERFLACFFETLFYSVVTIVLAFLLGKRFTWIEWFGAFFPMTGAVQGYVQTYLVFYLLLPLVGKCFLGMQRQVNKYLIIIMTVVMILFRWFASVVWSEQSIYCRLFLFIYIAFVLRYIKHYKNKIASFRMVYLSIFLVGYMCLLAVVYLSALYPNWDGWKWIAILTIDEGGILYLVTGLSLFLFFYSIQIKQSKTVNFFASTTLAIILIHDGHFFRQCTWELLKTSEWYYSKYYFLFLILSACSIYFVCTLIDVVRKNFIGKWLKQLPFYKKICTSWNNIFT